MEQFINLIPTLGFPIIACIGVAWYCYWLTKKHSEDMEKVQSRCQEREDKLYVEIEENRKINTEALATISKYVEKLDGIQEDVQEIKKDVTILMIKE